jgi:hypothetical protein
MSGLVVGAMLALAPAVEGAVVSGTYKGTTSQHANVRLKISRGYVRGLTTHIRDNCGAYDLQVGVGPLEAMKISRSGRFGDTFGSQREPLRVSGVARGSKVTVTLNDTSIDAGHTCHGRVTVTLRRA